MGIYPTQGLPGYRPVFLSAGKAMGIWGYDHTAYPLQSQRHPSPTWPMDETSPTISSHSGADQWTHTLGGSWSAAALAQSDAWSRLNRSLAALGPQARAQGEWDLRSLERLDHTGAQLLWTIWGQRWPDGLLTLPAQRAMLDRVARYSVPAPPVRKRRAWQHFLSLGERVFQVVDHGRDLVRLIGNAVAPMR